MQTSGQIIDGYDDVQGQVLRTIYPTPAEIPELVKSAHALSAPEHDRLPDDLYALVLLNGDGQKMRKFACIDPGNTVLSIAYLLKTAARLPAEAQKLAAGNLLTACGWYGLTPPEELRKLAEASGTALMPMQQPAQPPSGKAVIKKTAMEPHLDVSGSSPRRTVTTKEATHFALRGQYPLSSYVQVKQAMAYFKEYGRMMVPEDRREYCLNLTKRASDLSIEVDKEVEKYGSLTYAPQEELNVARDLRLQILHDPVEHQMVHALFQKTSSVDPELFVHALSELDQMTGLDQHYDSSVVDPFYSTFGSEKKAEEFSLILGNDYVTEQGLTWLAQEHLERLRLAFGEEFAVAYRKNPVAIFKSLPAPQQKMVMRMASERTTTGATL